VLELQHHGLVELCQYSQSTSFPAPHMWWKALKLALPISLISSQTVFVLSSTLHQMPHHRALQSAYYQGQKTFLWLLSTLIIIFDMDPKTFSMSKDCSSYINVESRKVSRNPARLETKEEGLALLHIRWNWNWYHLN